MNESEPAWAYHYTAAAFQGDKQALIDGIATANQPIASPDAYESLKAAIMQDQAPEAERLVITSLSLVHKPEPTLAEARLDGMDPARLIESLSQAGERLAEQGHHEAAAAIGEEIVRAGRFANSPPLQEIDAGELAQFHKESDQIPVRVYPQAETVVTGSAPAHKPPHGGFPG